ncbi:TolC family protein [Reichenbachiella sp. MALMAid0571]|uniref:TolC family protein n=1 Tax=Reichenbachiella sp. MALMAid0571 TaxID=3143939 RepID=UPI0032DE74CA
MIILKLMLTLLLAMGIQFAFGQKVLTLSLAEATELAERNNWEIQKVEQSMGIATANLKAANSVFLPSINLSETYITTSDPLAAFGFKLQQKNVSAEDFNPTLMNDPGTINNFKTRIYAEQPIINPDGISARKAASIGVHAAELNIKWSKRMANLQAKNLYFILHLSYEKKKVLESSLKATLENYKVANDLYEQDMLHKADLLSAKMRLTEIESDIIAIDNQISDINSSFTHFLHLDEGVTIHPIDSISNIELENTLLETTEIPMSRADLQAKYLQTQASDQMVKSSKGSMLPRLNAFGSYEWNDTGFFGANANNYLLGAKLEWDIFKGGKNLAKIQKAVYQKKLADIDYEEGLSASKRELSKVRSGLTLAKKQIDLAVMATQHAEEAYRVRKDRFKEGMEQTSDLLQAQSNLQSRKISHLQSINTYQQLIFKLELLLDKEITIKKK